jgi:hypothetical protein
MPDASAVTLDCGGQPDSLCSLWEDSLSTIATLTRSIALQLKTLVRWMWTVLRCGCSWVKVATPVCLHA